MARTLYFDATQVRKLCSSVPADAVIDCVGDHGVYLMSCAQPVGARDIVYARGINPDVDPFDVWWERKREIWGGDDYGDAIGTAGDVLDVANLSSRWVRLTLTKSTITATNDAPSPPRKPAPSGSPVEDFRRRAEYRRRLDAYHAKMRRHLAALPGPLSAKAEAWAAQYDAKMAQD